mgnify:FL=1
MFSTMKRRTKVAVVAVCTALAVTSVSPASAASAQGLENQAFWGSLAVAALSVYAPIALSEDVGCTLMRPVMEATSGPYICR